MLKVPRLSLGYNKNTVRVVLSFSLSPIIPPVKVKTLGYGVNKCYGGMEGLGGRAGQLSDKGLLTAQLSLDQLGLRLDKWRRSLTSTFTTTTLNSYL